MRSFLKDALIPIIVALIGAGSAPFWWPLVRPTPNGLVKLTYSKGDMVVSQDGPRTIYLDGCFRPGEGCDGGKAATVWCQRRVGPSSRATDSALGIQKPNDTHLLGSNSPGGGGAQTFSFINCTQP
jgi:hypothetical protein